MKPEIEATVREYLSAVGNKDLATVEKLITPDIAFVGPAMQLAGARDVLAALRRIGAIHVRNDVKRVFVDGDEACAIYDFVTDTVGVVPTIEWLGFEAGRIRSVRLYYDQLPWQTLRQELAKRATQASA
ncbi:MAG TPA: nuclear transport factor 2 family protein [Polyangiaceae bacterium]|nr:nuclear transport factor 2 family protein [Polyangiaceae bacterium]